MSDERKPFEPLDGLWFSRAELQRKFGDEAEWFYNRLAQIANAAIESDKEHAARVVTDWVKRFTAVETQRDQLRAQLAEAVAALMLSLKYAEQAKVRWAKDTTNSLVDEWITDVRAFLNKQKEG